MKFIVLEKQRKVVALSSYAGKTVRAEAQCADTDAFDPEVGKKLAELRINKKVSKLRMKRAKRKRAEAMKNLAEAQKWIDKMEVYLENSFDAYVQAALDYDNYMEQLNE